jgi:hypothetical protein
MEGGLELAVYETYEDIFGRRSSLPELEAEIKQYSLSSLLWLCAATVTGLQLWDRSDSPADAYRTFLNLFFPPPLAMRFWIGHLSKNPRREVFHRRQILLVAKLGILNCSSGGIDLRSASGRFGSILLKANDQFHHELLRTLGGVVSTKEDYSRLIAEFVAVTEYGNPHLGYQMARSFLLLTQFTQKLASDADYVDCGTEYAASIGFSLEEHIAMLFGLHARFGRNLIKTVATNPGLLPFCGATLAGTPISPARSERFFSTISAAPSRLQREILNRDFGPNDFTVFKKWPAVEQWYNLPFKNCWLGHLLLDNHMLLEKQLSGPYWFAFGKHQKRFSRFWGRVFEEYVNHLLMTSTAGTPVRFIQNVCHPRAPQRQICDGLIVDRDTLVIIEYKGAIFTADAKYSGNPVILAQEIDDKLIRDQVTGNKKAAIQLADAINSLMTDPTISISLGIDLSTISSIFPLVVTLDGIGGTIGISPYLDLAFQSALSLGAQRRSLVQAMTCVDISSLEVMTEYFHVSSLPDLLRKWHEFSPSFAAPFLATPLTGMTRKVNQWLKDASDEIFRSIAKILFPDADPEATLRNVKGIRG